VFSRCESVGRLTGDDVEVTTRASTPSDSPDGNYDVFIRLFGISGLAHSNGCDLDNDLSDEDWSDRVRIGDNTNVTGGSGGSVGSEQSELSSLTTSINSLLALMQQLLAQNQAPSVPAWCSQLSQYSYLTFGSTGAQVSAAQSFLMSHGFSIPALTQGAAYGYWGSQSGAAFAQANAQCH